MSYTNEHQIATWNHDVRAKDPVMAEHDWAMKCRDCEDFVDLGSQLFVVLQGSNERWRDQVFRGTVRFDENHDSEIRRAYELWVEGAAYTIDVLVHRMEQESFEVEGAERLRKILLEAQAIIRDWDPPRLSLAIGLRDQHLTVEGAAALERILSSTAPLPHIPLKRDVKEVSAVEFKRRLRS